eukprot:3319760-Prymnesium_polylepis.2
MEDTSSAADCIWSVAGILSKCSRDAGTSSGGHRTVWRDLFRIVLVSISCAARVSVPQRVANFSPSMPRDWANTDC